MVFLHSKPHGFESLTTELQFPIVSSVMEHDFVISDILLTCDGTKIPVSMKNAVNYWK